jgi:hypothetical protein
MCDNSDLLQLQAEREFECDEWQRRFQEQAERINVLYLENVQLKHALESSNIDLEAKMREKVSLLSRIQDDSKKINALKTSR